jgi:predicted HTH domain antitoxin
MAVLENLLEPNLIRWQFDQLVKSGLYPDEQAVLRNALQALFQINPRIKIKMLVNAYAAGDISLGQAATLLGVSQEEMKDILREADVLIHLGPQTIRECLDDAQYA